ncbi:MAG: 30S ribosomal protein S5 [Epsilonproteobacteria bacterium]|nr:30S ribosomal protein S5 [Campylobacterota bacterium]
MAEERNKKSQVAATKQAAQQEEYAESVLNIRRVAKVIKGGRRFAFSALVVVGDKKGRVGIALGKGREVSSAISKALRRAKKTMFVIPLYKTTIPYTILGRHGSSSVLLRSAAKGTGLIAGGAVRSVMEALGVRDVLAKSLGSSNPHNVAKATIDALSKLKSAQHFMKLRGKNIKEIFEDKNVSA